MEDLYSVCSPRRILSVSKKRREATVSFADPDVKASEFHGPKPAEVYIFYFPGVGICSRVLTTFNWYLLLPEQTLVLYQFSVVVIVFNNGGVYGGDRRSPDEINGPYKDDPAPISFVPSAAYHTLIEAFGGKGYLAGTLEELKSALAESFTARKPAVINVIIDPYAGAESGRLQHKN